MRITLAILIATLAGCTLSDQTTQRERAYIEYQDVRQGGATPRVVATESERPGSVGMLELILGAVVTVATSVITTNKLRDHNRVLRNEPVGSGKSK